MINRRSFNFRYSGARSQRQVDMGLVLGLTLSFSLVIGGMLAGGGMLNFFSLGSVAIVFGGTIGATLVNFSPEDIKNAWDAFKNVLFKRQNHPHERIRYLVSLAHAVRTQGRLKVLEQETAAANDSFLKCALEMTLDGQNPVEVRRILETEMRITNDRASRAFQVFETMGNYTPALGLIGTLIGLIQMLSALNSPETVGPAMSTALVSTFYGAVASNLVFLPTAGKLRNRSEEEAIVKALTIEGVIGVSNEENPLLVEQRLQSFIPSAA